MGKSLTLLEARELFLLEDRAELTRKTYYKDLTLAFGFLGPKRHIDTVTREDILRYVDHLRSQTSRYVDHPLRREEQGGLSPKTIEKRVKTLVTFFNWLKKNRYIDQSPGQELNLRRFQRPHGASRAATPEELRAMLAIAEAKALLGRPKHLAIFLFICDTGCRAGETAELVIGNLYLHQFGAWVLGKGDSLRPVFFGQRTADALRDWLAHHPDPRPEARVFGVTSESVSQVIRRLALAAGIERPISSHVIRHRVGQVWSAAKMNEQATQLKLGHENSSITIDMYYNTTYEHVRQASIDLALASIYGVPDEPRGLDAPQVMPRSSP